MASDRIYGLDILKALCAFCVVAIHAKFSERVIGDLDAVFRMAVPVFFMLTGYFYADVRRWRKEGVQLRRMALLCVSSCALYILWNAIRSLYQGGWSRMLGSLTQVPDGRAWMDCLLFNASPYGYHLWYLNAIIYVLLIAALLFRLWPKRAETILLAMTPLLLIMDLLLCTYAPFFLHREVPVLIYRNYLGLGLPYFALGCCLRRDGRWVRALRARPGLLAALTLLFMLTSALERKLLIRLSADPVRDHYVSTTFLAVSVMLLFTSPWWEGRLPLLHHIGCTCSTYIYIVHPIFLTVFEKKLYGRAVYEGYTALRPVIVYAASALVSLLYARARSELMRRAVVARGRKRTESPDKSIP